ncbi:MAG: DNA recombination protein RmuC [Bacteroidetes bacterium]|nr:DNA recombination protein RmuC [Bacteroidota bacterium]
MVNNIILIVALIILVEITILVYRSLLKKPIVNNESELKYKIEGILGEISRIESAVKQEISTNRAEGNEAAKNTRLELSNSLKGFEEKLNSLTNTLELKLKEANESNVNNVKDNRKEIKEALDNFKSDFSKSIDTFNTAQKDNFFALLNKQEDQNKNTSDKLDKMREVVETKISDLQTGNEKKLDEMRATVDEKLQKTLETRLGESFKLVSERLEAVHKGLGDMQQLATGVGDLKRVLSNVKTRGVLGEYQLENILEQILTLDQYGKNVKTKEGSNSMVEFAVKLPGRENNDKVVWLPIDSKFPKEDFELLIDAYEQAVPENIEECRKSFVKGIRKCAVDICTKYIDPPNTTDFAILFLPFESLYAEVLRTPGLFESIQRECKIIITGPTTLSALLNSLQMGFRTLAIEKRSSEVWQLLGAVKTEFGNFGTILEKTQKKLQEASNVIDQASVRSRAIERKLKTVQELPKTEAANLLGEVAESNIIETEEE